MVAYANRALLEMAQPAKVSVQRSSLRFHSCMRNLGHPGCRNLANSRMTKNKENKRAKGLFNISITQIVD